MVLEWMEEQESSQHMYGHSIAGTTVASACARCREMEVQCELIAMASNGLARQEVTRSKPISLTE